jgi:putative ABC transport system substrate-binding protein
MRHIGILMNRAASDPEGQARVVAFKQGMQQLGWSEGRNIELDPRWGEDDINVEQKYAAELIALAPDLIFASGTLSVAALQRLSPTVRVSQIRSAPVSSTVSPDRAAMRRGL